MRKIIIEKLQQIEKQENVRILHAVESGSRAWGFESPDSDFDVRFIYVRPRDYYLKLEQTRDVLEFPINDLLDVNGWDLQKALRLLHRSNPSVFEWFKSPIVYRETAFSQEFIPLMENYFSAKSGLYHYLNMADGNYREYLDDYVKSGHDPAHLNELHFFKNCSSVVSIISLPKEYKLSYMDLNRLKSHLNGLFPNTTLKRYALVIGASANISLTTLIVKSPCLSDDFLTLIVAFIKRCFAKDHYRFDEHLDKAVIEMISNEEWNDTLLDSMLNEFENPAKILDTNWYAIKPMYEKKYRELIREKEKFVSINDIRLSRESVKKALLYLREIYRHRVSKTRILSLNPRLGEANAR